MFARRLLALLCLSTGMTIGIAGVAAADCTGYCPGPTITTSASTAEPGQTLVVMGSGWCPGSTVGISFDGSPVGSAGVTKKGKFAFSHKTSKSTSTGSHTYAASGIAADCATTATVSTSVLFVAGNGSDLAGASAFTGRPSSSQGGADLFPAAHLIESWQIGLVAVGALGAVAIAMRSLRRRIRIRRVILYGHSWRDRR